MASENQSNEAGSPLPNGLADEALVNTYGSDEIQPEEPPPVDAGGMNRPPNITDEDLKRLQGQYWQTIHNNDARNLQKKPSKAKRAIKKIAVGWKVVAARGAGTEAHSKQSAPPETPSKPAPKVSEQQAVVMNEWRKTQEEHAKDPSKPLTFEQHLQLAKAKQLDQSGVEGAQGTKPSEAMKKDAEALRDAMQAYGKRPTDQELDKAIGCTTATLDRVPVQSDPGRGYIKIVKTQAEQQYAKDLPGIDVAKVDVPQVQDKVLQEQLKTLHTKEPPNYKGHDTEREYDKYVARSYEKALIDPKNKGKSAQLQKDYRHNPNILLGIDKRAAVRLAEAGHSDVAIRNAIARRSPLARNLPSSIQSNYTRKVTQHLKSKGVQDRIDQARQVKERYGLKSDRSLQKLEAAKRDHAVRNVRDVHAQTKGAPIKEKEVFQSNYRARDSRGIAESRERHNIEVTKAHLPAKDHQSRDAIKHAGGIASRSPDAAAHSYSPRQQQQYGRAIAYHAAHSESINQTPEKNREKQSNERYVYNYQKYNTEREQRRQQQKQQQQKVQDHYRARERTR